MEIQHKKINGASRLEVILRQATLQQDKKSVLEVWTNVFKLQEEDQFERTAAVMDSLFWLNGLVDEVEAAMTRTEHSPDLFVGHLGRVRHGISGASLTAPWLGHKQHLTTEVLHVLSMCSSMLEDEESYLDSSALESLAETAREVEQTMTDASIPPALRTVMAKHVKAMQRALRQYEVHGARAMHEVVKRAYVDTVEILPLAAVAAQSSEPYRRFDALLTRFSAVTASAFKKASNGLAGRFIQLYGGVTPMLEQYVGYLRVTDESTKRVDATEVRGAEAQDSNAAA